MIRRLSKEFVWTYRDLAAVAHSFHGHGGAGGGSWHLHGHCSSHGHGLGARGHVHTVIHCFWCLCVVLGEVRSSWLLSVSG